jgi:DNA polymerase-1
VVNGKAEDKDTTVQNGTLKSIYKWSNRGTNPTAVCFDRPVIARKVFFQNAFPEMGIGTGNEYKGNRDRMADTMFTASQDVMRILQSANVACFAKDGYEADDLIFACIKWARENYPDLHIDVVTNDADLLPLVCDEVSVYLRSKKGTFAENKAFEKNHYIEVTPRNYQQVVENLSYYKGYIIPYNALLLHKLLRGDPSDQFGNGSIKSKFSPKKWNAMIDRMISGGVDFSTSFRYGEPVVKIMQRSTGEEFSGTMEEVLAREDKSDFYQKICNPVELDTIIGLLKEYTDLNDDELDIIEKIYWGMNLNMTYPHKDPRFARRGFVVGKKSARIVPFSEIELNNAARDLQINLIKA